MVEYIEYQKEKIPVRIAYRTLLQYKTETGQEVEAMGEGEISEQYDKLLTLFKLAVNSGFKALGQENPYSLEQLEDILEGNEGFFLIILANFSSRISTTAEQMPEPMAPNRQRRRNQAKVPAGK